MRGKTYIIRQKKKENKNYKQNVDIIYIIQLQVKNKYCVHVYSSHEAKNNAEDKEEEKKNKKKIFNKFYDILKIL